MNAAIVPRSKQRLSPTDRECSMQLSNRDRGLRFCKSSISSTALSSGVLKVSKRPQHMLVRFPKLCIALPAKSGFHSNPLAPANSCPLVHNGRVVFLRLATFSCQKFATLPKSNEAKRNPSLLEPRCLARNAAANRILRAAHPARQPALDDLLPVPRCRLQG